MRALLFPCILLLAAAPAVSAAEIGLETGIVTSGYNEARIPGTTGTRFSLSEDLSIDRAVFARVRATVPAGDRTEWSMLAAPLTLKAGGDLPRAVSFAGGAFPAGTRVSATYRFDSYRLTWRRLVRRTGRFEAWLGATAKVRDAEIALAGGGISASKKNTGLVPLAHFKCRWRLPVGMAAVCEGDALAAPQGRAEDVLAALEYPVSGRVVLTAGYRVLEGGADNDEVYNFALLHYAVLGCRVVF